MGSWSEDNWDRIMADYQSRHEQAIEQRDEVLFKGHDLFKLPQRELRTIRPQMQYIFQDPYSALNPQMTIGRSIGEPLLEHRLATKADVNDRVAQILEICAGARARVTASAQVLRPARACTSAGRMPRRLLTARRRASASSRSTAGTWLTDVSAVFGRGTSRAGRAGTAHRVTIHGIIMLMCGLDASSTAPAMVDPNEVPTEPCGGHPRQSFGERARRHDILDDQVAGSEQRGDAQAGQDLHDAEDQEIAHHHAEHHIADGEQRQEHDHMPPVRGLSSPGNRR